MQMTLNLYRQDADRMQRVTDDFNQRTKQHLPPAKVAELVLTIALQERCKVLDIEEQTT